MFLLLFRHKVKEHRKRLACKKLFLISKIKQTQALYLKLKRVTG